MNTKTPPTMTDTLTALLERGEGHTIQLSRGLTIRIASLAPLCLELRRDNQFPSPTECQIVTRALHKIRGRNDTYEATDYEEYRDRDYNVTRRVGIATISEMIGDDTDVDTADPPLTYPPRQEALIMYAPLPTYPD